VSSEKSIANPPLPESSSPLVSVGEKIGEIVGESVKLVGLPLGVSADNLVCLPVGSFIGLLVGSCIGFPAGSFTAVSSHFCSHAAEQIFFTF